MGLFPLGASWGAGGLVVAGGVGDEVFAGGGVDDSDVEVLDEDALRALIMERGHD